MGFIVTWLLLRPRKILITLINKWKMSIGYIHTLHSSHVSVCLFFFCNYCFFLYILLFNYFLKESDWLRYILKLIKTPFHYVRRNCPLIAENRVRCSLNPKKRSWVFLSPPFDVLKREETGCSVDSEWLNHSKKIREKLVPILPKIMLCPYKKYMN